MSTTLFVLLSGLALAQQPVPPQPGDLPYKLPPIAQQPQSVAVRSDVAAETVDWGHAPLKVAELNTKGWTGKGVKVMVLDTGCDVEHAGLQGRVVKSRDFTNSKSGFMDVNGHGTWCHGCIGEKADNTGMRGVAPECDLYNGKVLDDSGSGWSSWIAAGIDWGVNEKVHVISMSLGSSNNDPTIGAAVDRALAAGIVIVAAAGNEGQGGIGFPGGRPGVICVAAVDINLKVASFSSRGNRLDVAGPGVNTRATIPGNRYANLSGTSMATPYVAASVACIIQAKNAKGESWTPASIRELFNKKAQDLAPTGFDRDTGNGLVQPVAALPTGPDLPPPPPTDPVSKPVVVEVGGVRVELDFTNKKAVLPRDWTSNVGPGQPSPQTTEEHLKAKGLTPEQIEFILRLLELFLKNQPTASAANVGPQQSYNLQGSGSAAGPCNQRQLAPRLNQFRPVRRLLGR